MLRKCIMPTAKMSVKNPMNLDEQRFLRGIGERIRKHRISKGLTQAQLAEKAGLHRTFVGAVERGERNVAILNVRLIARALRVSFSVLLD